MAEKSLVNDVTDSEGVDPLDDAFEPPLLLLLELDELPQAASATLELKASKATTALPPGKCITSPLLAAHGYTAPSPGPGRHGPDQLRQAYAGTRKRLVNVCEDL
jgi:hypothetical protein